jgi:hypothetical protein
MGLAMERRIEREMGCDLLIERYHGGPRSCMMIPIFLAKLFVYFIVT